MTVGHAPVEGPRPVLLHASHTSLLCTYTGIADMMMSLSLIDGVVASERHETSGNPVEMNLVIAATKIVTSMNARVLLHVLKLRCTSRVVPRDRIDTLRD